MIRDTRRSEFDISMRKLDGPARINKHHVQLVRDRVRGIFIGPSKLVTGEPKVFKVCSTATRVKIIHSRCPREVSAHLFRY